MIGSKRFLAATTALAFATICVATASLIERDDGAPPTSDALTRPESGPGPWGSYPRIDLTETLPIANTIMTPRPVFRHSVIPGGSYARSELDQAVLRYPEVARHYNDLNLERMEPAKLSRDGEYYLSYKKGGAIYWTSYKVRLPQGEPVMTDGAQTIRARCGNRLSEEVMTPRLPPALEPQEMEFARVEVPSLPVTPLIQPPGGSTWLPILIPWIPLLVMPGHDHTIPPGPVVPEPTTMILLAMGLAFVLAARHLLRQ